MQKYETTPRTVQAIQFLVDNDPGKTAVGTMFMAYPIRHDRDGFFLDVPAPGGGSYRVREYDWLVQEGAAGPVIVLGPEDFRAMYREPRAAMAETAGARGPKVRENTFLQAADPGYAARLAALDHVRDDVSIAKEKELARSLVPGQYIGTKIIEMLGYAEDNLGSPGLRVRYPDGYESWSPVEAFVGAYQRTSGLPFGLALAGTMKGYRACRAGWNGAGQWVAMSPGSKALPAERFWNPNNRAFAAGQPGGVADVVPCMTMKNAQGEIVMGWAPSQGDLFATDWVLLPPLEAVPQ